MFGAFAMSDELAQKSRLTALLSACVDIEVGERNSRGAVAHARVV
jgi:hypothetical protein